MQPNFPNGEYLLTDKVSYRFGKAERGDVVVFEPPGSEGEEYIKRIVGLPGEEISLTDGKVFINGQMLDETYLSDTLRTSGGSFLSENTPVVVPDQSYFVLGDNRIASSDSRMWGFVTKDKITGRAWIIYWPPPNVGLVEQVTYGYDGF